MKNKWEAEEIHLKISECLINFVECLLITDFSEIMGKYPMGYSLQCGLVEDIHGIINFKNITSF